MARRHTAYWAFGLLLLLATCAFAYDADSYGSGDSGYSSGSGDKDYKKKTEDSGYSGDSGDKKPAGTVTSDFCDPAKQTKSSRIAVYWKDRPEETADFFKKFGIELRMLYEWGTEASIYEATDAKEAQDIMDDLLVILSGDKLTGYGPLGDRDAQRAIKYHVASVFGECYYVTSASQPADVPRECSAALPNSCTNPGLWGLNVIRAPEVWDQLTGEVVTPSTSSVMVIDSGVNSLHQDLVDNLVPALTVTGYDGPPQPVASGNAVPPLQDPQGHGTHVSGTVFARWNNGADTPVGVVGRALGGSCGCAVRNPQNDDERRSMEDFCLRNCIDFAAANRVRVINLSWGGPRPTVAPANDPLRQAIVRFCNTGGIVAIAAGNDGIPIIQPGRFDYPAALAADLAGTNPTCIITVANLQQTPQTLSQDSSYGAAVKVAAPGSAIFSTYIGSTTATRFESGTSMASPHVAGMATLLFNEFTDAAATQAQVHNCIVNRARTRAPANPLNPRQVIAGGIVNLAESFQCMMGDPVCPTEGLPSCVNGTSARAVRPARCNNSTNLCRPIAGNTRAVCQYDYLPDGRLCRVTASSTDFEELSLEEMQTMGLSGEPTQYMEGEEDIEIEASLLGASEAQQARRRRQKLTCGQCINRQCVTQTAKWCKRPPTAAQG